MKLFTTLGVVVFVAGLFAAPCQAGDPGDYLNNGGTLKETLIFRKDTTGLAPPGTTPKGEVYTIQPTGEWTAQVSGAKGKLTAKQLAALGQFLATQDFKSLPQVQGYEQKAIDEVYQRVSISFGKKTAMFLIQAGVHRTAYMPAPGDAKAAAWARFVALELFLTDLMEASKVEEKKGK
jgi:hypothetical protein